MIRITLRHHDEEKAIRAGGMIANQFENSESVIVRGPVPALISRVRNQYLQEVWLKVPHQSNVQETTKRNLLKTRDLVHGEKGLSGVQIIFDVDPY
ncbi:MAG: hypothetical protein QM743_01070 [Chitinophagaceae bacterium]